MNDSSPAAAALSVPGSAPAVQPPPSPLESAPPPPAAPLPNRLRRVIVRALIVGLARTDGTSVILVTHDPATAEAADRTLVIRDGRIVGDEQQSKR